MPVPSKKQNELDVDVPSLSGKESVLLRLLVNDGESYGLALVHESDGRLKRGTVYVTLQRMEDKGFVVSREAEGSSDPGRVPRRLYRATGLGAKALAAHEMVASFILSGAT